MTIISEISNNNYNAWMWRDEEVEEDQRRDALDCVM